MLSSSERKVFQALRRLPIASLFFVGVLCHVHAEAPPCGIGRIRPDGSNPARARLAVDDRYVPATPEHVKAAALLALPALAAKVQKVNGLHIESDTDGELAKSAWRTDQDDGVHGILAHGLGIFGHFRIDIKPETRDGIAGALLHVDFYTSRYYAGNDRYTTPMAEAMARETACLATILSFNNPPTNPRGVLRGGPSTGTDVSRSVVVADGTPIKVQLFEPLYSKELKKNSARQGVQFEVAADVKVHGVTVVQRGALALGHFTRVEKAESRGRNGEVDFAFDSVTAMDGQNLPLTRAEVKSRGGPNDTDATKLILATGVQLAAGNPLVGLLWLVNGKEAFIRAGTSFDLEVSGERTVEAGQ